MGDRGRVRPPVPRGKRRRRRRRFRFRRSIHGDERAQRSRSVAVAVVGRRTGRPRSVPRRGVRVRPPRYQRRRRRRHGPAAGTTTIHGRSEHETRIHDRPDRMDRIRPPLSGARRGQPRSGVSRLAPPPIRGRFSRRGGGRFGAEPSSIHQDGGTSEPGEAIGEEVFDPPGTGHRSYERGVGDDRGESGAVFELADAHQAGRRGHSIRAVFRPVRQPGQARGGDARLRTAHVRSVRKRRRRRDRHGGRVDPGTGEAERRDIVQDEVDRAEFSPQSDGEGVHPEGDGIHCRRRGERGSAMRRPLGRSVQVHRSFSPVGGGGRRRPIVGRGDSAGIHFVHRTRPLRVPPGHVG
mmetsp:Transcript_19383/g.56693  ORF Transcript_19383/g.56693 Transcript_19383/m.56693 type:complete len:351 (+) Transcript_19383:382-1434(+)